MREEAERFKIYGIKGNEKYEELKSNMLHNKIKTHEYQENSKCPLAQKFNLYFNPRKNR